MSLTQQYNNIVSKNKNKDLEVKNSGGETGSRGLINSYTTNLYGTGINGNSIPPKTINNYQNSMNSNSGITNNNGVINNNTTTTPSASNNLSSDRITSINNNWQEALKQVKMNSLNTKNELALANRQALKNMETYLKSLGLQGTGLGQSNYTNLASSYANQIAEANRAEQQQTSDLNMQYQNQLLDAKDAQQAKLEAEQAKLEAEQAEGFNTLTSLMASAETKEELNDIITKYGYGTIDGQGNVIWNQNALAKLTDRQKNELMTSHSLFDSAITRNNADLSKAEQESKANEAYAFTMDELNSATTKEEIDIALSSLGLWIGKDGTIQGNPTHKISDTQMHQLETRVARLNNDIIKDKNNESYQNVLAQFSQAQSDEELIAIAKQYGILKEKDNSDGKNVWNDSEMKKVYSDGQIKDIKAMYVSILKKY